MSGKSIKRFEAFSTLINVLMGTGPILLPPVIASAGLLLGAGVLLVMVLLSLIGAEFIIEALSIANCMKRYGERDQSQPLNTSDNSSYS